MKRADRLTPNSLRRFREQFGYEQMDVAYLLGHKSHARVSQWETGAAKPSLESLLQLSIIYRTMAEELYYDLRQEYIKDIEERERALLSRRESG